MVRKIPRVVGIGRVVTSTVWVVVGKCWKGDLGGSGSMVGLGGKGITKGSNCSTGGNYGMVLGMVC